MGKYKRSKKYKNKVDNTDKESTSRELVVDFLTQNDLMRFVASRRFMSLISKIYISDRNRIAYVLGKFINYRASEIYYTDYYGGNEDSARYAWNQFSSTQEREMINKWNHKRRNSYGFYDQREDQGERPDFSFKWSDLFEHGRTPNAIHQTLKNGHNIHNKLRFVKCLKFNFIDISDDNQFVTFVPLDKRKEESWRLGEHSNFTDSKVVKMKIGRFINQFYRSLLDNGYFDKLKSSEEKITLDEYGKEIYDYFTFKELGLSQKDVENFVNSYKLFYGIEFGKEEFEFAILKGNDIKKAYMRENQMFGGTMQNSCMNDKTNFLDLYSKNENVSLLVLRCHTKIIGRALLWETTKGFKIMDRVYYGRDHDQPKFKMWAKENGYLMKDGDLSKYNYKGKHYIKLDRNNTYEKYPYLDSFKYFNRFTKKLQYHKPSKGGIFYPFKVLYNLIAYRDLVCTDGKSYVHGRYS